MSTKKFFNIIFLILTLAFFSTANAQKKDNTNTFSTAYTDSLALYKARIDSLMAANDSLRAENGYPADNKYFRLFAPTTYYPDITSRMLSINADSEDYTDKGLMSLYLKHPELVKYSASQFKKFDKDTKTGDDTKQPQRLELTKQVQANDEPLIEATDIDDAPLDMYVTKPHFWTFAGDYFLQFLQNHVSENWYKSGSDSYSMMGVVTLQYNYNNKQKLKWDNKLEMRLGFQTTEADTVNTFKASDDLIRYTSKVGLQAHKSWYYTMLLTAQTQFTKGLRDNNSYVFSDFMSPFKMNASIGMDYTVTTKNKKLSGYVHIAPLAFDFKYVDRKYLASSFGIKGNHHTSEDFGSQFTTELTWTPLNNFKWKTRLSAYTTYHKLEAEWENTLTLQFNRYISANIYLYPRFDDSVKRVNDMSYFQFKEYLSFGFSYSM